MSWLSHFGLRSAPFDKEIGDSDLWLPPSKKVLVDELEQALTDRASVLLVGEPGVGKTCVLRALRHRLPQAGFRLSYCHNATLGRRDFYRQLCLALGVQASATAAGVFHAVSKHVEDLGRDSVHPVFLLDEAHLLHQDTMDHLHILLNYEWDRRALLSLVLVGLPELESRLSRRVQRSLFTRIHTRLRIDPLLPDDTAEYLRFRLGLASCEREVFATEAISLIHDFTQGSLREVDRIATAAMKLAATRKKRLVERDHIAHLIDAEEAPSLA